MVKIPGRGAEQDTDDLVLDETETFRAMPPVTILKQLGLGRFARAGEFSLQQLRDGRTKNFVVSGVFLRERIDRAGYARGIEYRFGVWRLCHHNTVHDNRISDGGDGVIRGLQEDTTSLLIFAGLEKGCAAASGVTAVIFSLTGSFN